jgi:hypothetical protein
MLVWPVRPLSPSPDYCFEFKNRRQQLRIINRRGGVGLAGQTTLHVYLYQGCIQDFFLGGGEGEGEGGGGISRMTYFVCVCICTAAMRMLLFSRGPVSQM